MRLGRGTEGSGAMCCRGYGLFSGDLFLKGASFPKTRRLGLKRDVKGITYKEEILGLWCYGSDPSYNERCILRLGFIFA